MSKHLEVGARYVVGFLFNKQGSHVLLIRKKRPTWQAGKLNGPGGKIEDGEDGYQAMCREFQEETGANCNTWQLFAELRDLRGWSVLFFRAFEMEDFKFFETFGDNDESLEPVFVEGLRRRSDVIDNLKWLIPLALSKEDLLFSVNEVAR